MKILIIEDELRNAQRLKRMLVDIEPLATVIGPTDSITSTVEAIRQNQDIDLVLADIQLTDGLSFEALRQADCMAPVIFTTAYDEYAIQAFKFNSIDYLLKPIDETELAAAIAKEKNRIGGKENAALNELLNAMKKSNYQCRERFLIPFRDEFLIIQSADINHIFTAGHKVYLRLKDGTQHQVPESMDDLEKQLNPRLFFRANRQYIISAQSVHRISTWFGGKLMVRMHTWDKEEIVVSRDKVPLLKGWLND